MKKTGIIILGITLLFFLVSGWMHYRTYSYRSVMGYVNGEPLTLLLADTPEKRTLGLGKREGLKENEGMLFVFDTPDTYTFWMKDMKFPIDIIWLDENLKISYIVTDISPESYPHLFTPPQKALYVLEVPTHFVEKNRLKIGDIVEVNLNK